MVFVSFQERLKVPRGLGAPIGLAAADLALADAGFTDDIMDNLTEKEKERMVRLTPSCPRLHAICVCACVRVRERVGVRRKV